MCREPLFMSVPSLVSTLFKATPALAIGCTLLLSAATGTQSTALAQADIDTNEFPSGLSPAGISSNDLMTAVDTYFRRPSNSRSRSRSRTTTGTRQGSCLGDTETAFTIFGPNTDIGQTVSSYPEFVWYLPESETPFPVTFRLLAPNEAGIPTPVHTAELPYTPGFVKYQLPTGSPALVAGKEYRWQVVVECDPNYPSRSLAQELSFEKVSAPAGLSQAVTAAATDASKAVAYGEQGIWYEAIAQVAKATTIEAQAVRTGLLRDLSALESDNRQLSQDIEAIAEMTAR